LAASSAGVTRGCAAIALAEASDKNNDSSQVITGEAVRLLGTHQGVDDDA
jgi:hypothetical protein